MTLHYSNIFPHAILHKLPVWIFLDAVTVQKVTKFCQVTLSTQQCNSAGNSAGKPYRWYFRSQTFMEDQWKALKMDTSDSQCIRVLITIKAPGFLLRESGNCHTSRREETVYMGRRRSSVRSTPEQQALMVLSPQHAAGGRLYWMGCDFVLKI